MVYAFFDFDGTLTTKDTLRDFARYYWGEKFLSRFIRFLPCLIGYKFGLINSDQAKALFVQYFYKDEAHHNLTLRGQDYALQHLLNIEQSAVVKRMDWHLSQGHEVCVVTASLPFWVAPWCDAKGVKLIATQVETKDGKLTGRLLGKNCFGEQKVLAIQQEFPIRPSDTIYAYGDTESDYPMMNLADFAYDCSKNPHPNYIIAQKEPWYA